MSNAMIAAASLYNDPRYFSASEVRIRNNRRRRQQIFRRQVFLLALLAAVMIFFMAFMFSSLMADAQSDDFVPSFKYYKTITIHTDDTLWAVAEDNFDSEHYTDIGAYMAEIRSINGITNSDMLHAGEALIIPYYSSEFK